MKIKYESYDGKIFDSEEECQNYERENLLSHMWDLNGNPTTNLFDGFLIFFNSVEDIEHFIQLCCDEGVISAGLSLDDGTRDPDAETGYYYYNTYHEEWLQIPDAFVNKNLKR